MAHDPSAADEHGTSATTGQSHSHETGPSHSHETGPSHSHETGPSHSHETGSTHSNETGSSHSDATGHSHSPATGPMADASVRIARPNDASAVGMLQAAVWRDAYGGVLSAEVVDQFDPARFARVWRDSLKTPPSPRHVLLVGCAGAQVVGFAAVGPSLDRDADQTSGEMLAVGVHPEARRSGHGSRLLNAAVDTLRGKGFSSMSVWLLARDENTRAFLTAAGLGPDSAFRDRVVDADGSTLREVRLTTDLSQR